MNVFVVICTGVDNIPIALHEFDNATYVECCKVTNLKIRHMAKPIVSPPSIMLL